MEFYSKAYIENVRLPFRVTKVKNSPYWRINTNKEMEKRRWRTSAKTILPHLQE